MENNKKTEVMKIKARIRYKILLVVIPILLLTSLFIGLTAYYSSTNGITSIAKEFLGYKLNEIYKYASRQSSLVKEMNLTNDQLLIENSKQSVLDYSRTVLTSETGAFLALKSDGSVDIATITNIRQADASNILKIIGNKTSGWIEFFISGRSKVGVFINYAEWSDYLLIFDDRDAFYSNVNMILNYLIIILAASVIISSVLLLYFISRITSPIVEFVHTIQDITEKMDLTRRVKIYYKDEVGYLASYFNNMISELESAYNQIKNYAYQTVLAKNKEERIRFIFQKYVPSEVINNILNIPVDSMLIGNKQVISVLFSDIRSFTTISESMTPEELVLSLNAYFNKMGTEISKFSGIIDKFIGDAIMAIFGAPMVKPNDAENSVFAALYMVEALKDFNKLQEEKGKVNFKIGVGINTGDAIVGNIGSEQKIDYTVIGDTVNLASRLEGLTKKYHARIIISEFTKKDIKEGKFFYRELDNVRVKGKNEPVKIFEPFSIEEAEPLKQYYTDFNQALYLYYDGRFKEAKAIFDKMIERKHDDYLGFLYKERCEFLILNPPEKWDGVETWTEK